MSVTRNDGKYAEKAVQILLDGMVATSNVVYLRLQDSKAAGVGKGNLLQPNPSDFVMVVEGKASLLEVKSSITHSTLAKCTLRSTFRPLQISGARLWKMKGNLAVCIFYGNTGVWELWDMEHVAHAYLSPPRCRQLSPAGLLFSGNKFKLRDAMMGLGVKYEE